MRKVLRREWGGALLVVLVVLGLAACPTPHYTGWGPNIRFPLPRDSADAPGGCLGLAPGARTMRDVSDALATRLDRAGFRDSDPPRYAWFEAPEGFMLVTHMEQFDPATGRSIPGPNRWTMTYTQPEQWMLQFLYADLLGDREGRSRVFVFAVSTGALPFTERAGGASEGEGRAWARHYGAALPDEVAAAPLTPRHRCSAHVYEWVKRTEDPARMVVPGSGGTRSVEQHLAAANVRW